MKYSFHKLVKNSQEIFDFPNTTLLSIIRSHAKKFPKKDAIIYVNADTLESEHISYELFYKNILSLAYILKHEYHLKEGDAVALNLSNTPDILLFHAACWSIGCITVPLDTKRDDEDRKLYKLQETKSLVFVTSGGKEELHQAKELSKKIPKLCTHVISTKIHSELSKKNVLSEEEICENPNNQSLILFTSGTTALPKGVILTLRNLLLNADGIVDWLRITETDCFHIVLPLHHINSTTMSLATLFVGGTIVLSSRYSKSKFWQIMADYHCTLSSIVPTICFDLLSEQEAFIRNQKELKFLTRIQVGSAPVQPTDVIKFYNLYKIKLMQGYGSTETALRVTGVDVWDLSVDKYKELIESNTIGSELKWNNIQITKGNGSVAEENEVGEICIRGPVLTQGYLHNRSATEDAFVDGWFHSGDVGYWKTMFGKKVYFISGRKKEIIIKGGVNISPLFIENAILKQYPHVSTCYVVGYPDNRLGEEICAIVSFNDHISLTLRQQTMKKLEQDRKKCSIEGISSFETPAHIFEVPLSSLPMTSTGKVQRINIKAYLLEKMIPIAQTSKHIFRRITPFDVHEIDQIVQIHTKRWGTRLSIDKETVMEATKNGVVIAAIDNDTGKLSGSVFLVQINKKDLEQDNAWTQTYDGITGSLSLKPSIPNGDTYVLVSISTDGKPYTESVPNIETQYKKLLKKANEYIDKYVELGTDTVLSFHTQPKYGLKYGAEVVRILPCARPRDYEAVGFNVLMKYPQLPTNGGVSLNTSLGTQLIEAAFIYAVRHNIHTVYAYSRPSGYLQWLSQRS